MTFSTVKTSDLVRLSLSLTGEPLLLSIVSGDENDTVMSLLNELSNISGSDFRSFAVSFNFRIAKIFQE